MPDQPEAADPRGNSFWLPVGAIRGAEELVAKLNRRAARLGLAPMRLEIDREAMEVREQRREVVALRRDGIDVRVPQHVAHVEVVPARLIGEPPALPGWRMAASVERVSADAPAVFHRPPGYDGPEPPERYRHGAGCACEHCGTRRDRRRLYIFHRTGDGAFRQVGSTCLKDFSGLHGTNASIAARLDFPEYALRVIREFGEDWEPGGRGGGRPREEFGTPREVLAKVLRITSAHGFVGTGKAREEGLTSTRDMLLHFAHGGGHLPPELPDHPAKVDAILAWIEAVDLGEGWGQERAEMIRNARAYIAADVVTGRAAGLFCALPTIHTSYLREMDRRRQAAASRHVGRVGKRQEFLATVVAVRHYDGGRFGGGSITLLRDRDGNCLKWFNDIGPEGTTVRFKGTVKAHEEYRGERQTVLSRCAVIEDLGQAFPLGRRGEEDEPEPAQDNALTIA